jgi:hypothetical protein
MNRRFVPAILVAAVVTLGAGPSQTQSSNRHFLGLWGGVDINDGSQRTVSITDRDGDGVLEAASRDTYWTLCDGDRGLELATGVVGADNVLTTTGLVTCFNGAPGVAVQQTYEFSRREDTLFATPHGTTLLPITLHRMGGGPGPR